MIFTNVSEHVMERLSQGAMHAVLVPEPPELLLSSERIRFYRDTPDSPFSVECLVKIIYGIQILSDGGVFFTDTRYNKSGVGCNATFLGHLAIDLGYCNWADFIHANFVGLFPGWTVHSRISGNRNVHVWEGSVISFQ